MVYLLPVVRKYSVVLATASVLSRRGLVILARRGYPLFVVQGLGGLHPGSHPTGIQPAKQG